MESILHTPTDLDAVANDAKAKPVIVLLHGLLGMASNLSSIEKMLSHKYTIIKYDLPNHGKSPSLSDSSFVSMAQMLHHSLEKHVFMHTSKKTIHICGHSLGGKLAGVYALLYPQHVDVLVMLDIAPVTYPPEYRLVIEALQSVKQYINTDTTPNRSKIKDIIRSFTDDEVMIGFLAKNTYVPQEGTMDMYADIENIAENYDLLRSFPSKELDGKTFTKQVLCVRGGKSHYVLPEYHQEMTRFFPSWELETIAHADHIVHVTGTEELSQIFTEKL